MMADKFRPGI